MTLNSVILWERLLNIPFTCFDINNEKHLVALLYCRANTKNINNSTFKTYYKVYKQKPELFVEDIEQIESEFNYLIQFNMKDENQDNNDNEQQQHFVCDVIASLAFNGIDINFLLYKAKIFMLPTLFQALEKKQRGDMEMQRYWSFIALSPYLDKGATAKSVIPFDWDKDDTTQAGAKEITEEEKELAKLFFNNNNKTNI